jgi:predicted PurR-regulated permease PerM
MNEERLMRVLITFGLFLLLMVVGVWVAWETRQLLTPVLTALLVAYLLYPIMKWTSKIGISKWLTVTVLIFTMIITIALSIYSFVPAINTEVKVFSDPSSAVETMSKSNLLTKIQEFSGQLKKYGVIKEKWQFESIRETIQKWFKSQQDWILKGLQNMAVKGGQFLMIFFFVLIFALVDGDKFYRTAISLLPNHTFEAGIFIVNKSADMFGYYLRGVVIETIILGIVAIVLLVPVVLMSELTLVLALSMAALFAITNIVRIVGPIFGAVVGVIVVLTSTTDLKAMLGVLVVAIVVQVLDNIVVLPLVMEGQVNIHPVFSMVGVLAGGAIGGVLGMVLAIPVIAGVKITYQVITVEMKRFQTKPRDYGLAMPDM